MNMLKQILEWLNPKVIRDTSNDRLREKVAPIHKPDYEVYKDKKNQWRWRIVAKNGNIIGASCEGYKNKVDAEKNLRYITRLRLE
jgi:uncharacterized protein YegP (UPF0339 family)